MVIAWAAPAHAQTFPTPSYLREQIYSPRPPAPLPDPKTFRDYVTDGKLRLSLRDAMLILLEHSSEVHIDRLAVNAAEFNLVGAFANFDPMMFSTFNATRTITPTDSQLQGATTLSTLSQAAVFNYSQTVSTGTNINVGFSASKESTNSVYNFFNPYISGSLNFSVTQPLLKGNTRFINRAPILIAQRNLKQTQAQFEGNVSDSVYGLVQAYWNVVQARENLRINQKSQDLAQASYDKDKHALELGALPPLDIYQSEAQVANRKVAVIQSLYLLKSAEDQFRRLLGADQDPGVRNMDLDLVESPEPSGALEQVDSNDAVTTALAHRPEMEAVRQLIEANKIAVRVDHNSLLPNLSVQGIYESSGLGGNQYNLNVSPPALVSTGGLGDTFSQIGGFNYPTYGFVITLNLPIRNHAAEASLGRDLVQRRQAQYQERRRRRTLRSMWPPPSINSIWRAHRWTLRAPPTTSPRRAWTRRSASTSLAPRPSSSCFRPKPCSPRRRPTFFRRKSAISLPAPPSITPPECCWTITRSKCRRSSREERCAVVVPTRGPAGFQKRG